MKVEILCTGDEILSGKTVNTNYSHIARRLTELGFSVTWGTIVGDDRESLVSAFHEASQRADAVIVNGGLGPTIDDLSQEVAAQAMGVELELHQYWYDHIDAWYQARGRKMPVNNTKQAMLPVGAEFIDNPVGTACGFAVNIGNARFFFTPGVPHEMKKMVEEQIIPRLSSLRGYTHAILVKRFHSFGIGESRADGLLEGIESILDDRSAKLGFQSHYPQLEVKLTIGGETADDLVQKLQPVEQELRKRLGNFSVAEDDETLEGNVLNALSKVNGSLSIVEMHTAGAIAGRLMREDESSLLRQSISATQLTQLAKALKTDVDAAFSTDFAKALAKNAQQQSGTTHSLVALSHRVTDDESNTEPGLQFIIAVAKGDEIVCREGRLPGRRDWTVMGAAELALDCLRRYLLGLPVVERIDFEQH